MVWYHGAPADVRDIPPGTHMHGRFLLPLEGEEKTIPLREEQLKKNATFGTTTRYCWRTTPVFIRGAADHGKFSASSRAQARRLASSFPWSRSGRRSRAA
ncbi:MAG: hypothetical protein Ct9H300mP7_0630 [Verrucomicrobiota bacterium]|nr:MAG: hypothetical protein Ct9H300mP7_0630 [Verrucomicrobiota bacterium]